MFKQVWSTTDWILDDDIERARDINEGYLLGELFKNGTIAEKLCSVEIETINRCNNDCSFCPVNRYDDKRTYKKMEESLYKKIISDLVDIRYDGVVSLFSNNEPLIDNRILSFIAYAKTNLPNAKHVLYTNGKLLTKNIYYKLLEYLDLLVIDNYNDNLEINHEIVNATEMVDIASKCKVEIQIRRKNQILSDRGGLSPNKHNKKQVVRNSPCILPFIQMIIRPDGKISRCCQDAYGIETLGDVNVQSIEQIWKGKHFKDFRKCMINSRKNLDICNFCELIGLCNYYPESWNKMYVDEAIKIIIKRKKEGRRIILLESNNIENLYQILLYNQISVDGYATTVNCKNSKNDFYVMFDYEKEYIKSFKKNKQVCIDDWIVIKKIETSGLVENYNYKSEDVDRLIYASNSSDLVVWGAGETAKKLISYYNLAPVYMIDSFKTGCFLDIYNIYKPDECPENIKERTILIACNDYVSVLKKISEMEINNEKIIIGNNV